MKNKLIVLLIFLYSCKSKYISDVHDLGKLNNIPLKVSIQSYERDKAYISHTIRAYINMGYEIYFGYQDDFLQGSRDTCVKIHVDNIYYSHDSLKLLSIIAIESNPNGMKDEKRISLYGNEKNISPLFDGRSLVGTRNFSNEPWKIFILDLGFIHGGSSHQALIYEMKQEYFQKLKNYSFFCYDEANKGRHLKFEFNINQPEFWTGPLWSTDCYEGRAYFEVNDHREREALRMAGLKERKVWKPIQIQYPDSLLKLF
jgi:hypothetical protein